MITFCGKIVKCAPGNPGLWYTGYNTKNLCRKGLNAMPYFYYDSMLWVVLAVAVIGMIAAAALLLIFPHGDNPDDRNFIDAWSWALFGGVFVGSWRKVNPILLIVLSAGAGILIYYVF